MSDIVTPHSAADPIPAFTDQVPGDLRQAIGRAIDAWLLRTPSPHTRRAYRLGDGEGDIAEWYELKRRGAQGLTPWPSKNCRPTTATRSTVC